VQMAMKKGNYSPTGPCTNNRIYGKGKNLQISEKEVTVAQRTSLVDWMSDLELGQICARMQDELENEKGEEAAIIIISSRAGCSRQHVRECITLWRKERAGGRKK